MKKILLIVIDGLSDDKIVQLGGKTPLEAARKPNLDFLAKNGICGLIKPFLFFSKKLPDSDTSHLALLGFDPAKYYLGRGVYEALGLGMKLEKGDVAFRVNFATVDKNLKIIDRRAGRIKDTRVLIKALTGQIIDGIKIIIKKSWGHRGVLVLRGKNLSKNISDCDIKKIGIKPKKALPLDKSISARFTAEILNKFLAKAHQILKNHPFNREKEKRNLLPANYLLVRGAGQFRDISSFKEKFTLKSCCIAGGKLYQGIGRALKMDLIRVKGANGFFTTNLKGKIKTAIKMLQKYDFVFLHIKATDSLAEDGDFLRKKQFIEMIDKNIKPVLKLKNVLIVVTADHSTSSLKKSHCNNPIPVVIYGARKSGVEHFSEDDCASGKLKIFPQKMLMKKILKFAKS